MENMSMAWPGNEKRHAGSNMADVGLFKKMRTGLYKVLSSLGSYIELDKPCRRGEAVHV